MIRGVSSTLKLIQKLLGDFELLTRLSRSSRPRHGPGDRLLELFERRPKRRNERRRQAIDKSDRIDRDDRWMTVRIEGSNTRIESRKKLIFREHAALSERVEQSGFAGVRVTDERDFQDILAAGALNDTFTARSQLETLRAKRKFVF